MQPKLFTFLDWTPEQIAREYPSIIPPESMSIKQEAPNVSHELEKKYGAFQHQIPTLELLG